MKKTEQRAALVWEEERGRYRIAASMQTGKALHVNLVFKDAVSDREMLWCVCVFVCLRFDGDVVTTDERIRTLAQKWQPSKRLGSEEQSSKAVDTDMIILPCLVSVLSCTKTEEKQARWEIVAPPKLPRSTTLLFFCPSPRDMSNRGLLGCLM